MAEYACERVLNVNVSHASDALKMPQKEDRLKGRVSEAHVPRRLRKCA